MPTFVINQYGVIVTEDDRETKSMVRNDSPYFDSARAAVMVADWDRFYDIHASDARRIEEIEEAELNDAYDEEDDSLRFDSLESLLDYMRDVVADGIVTADMLGIEATSKNPHDLSQWNGSPIFYPTMEMAMAQHNRWSMFWDFHDFGPEAPNGYRYATVPRGIGPYAPEGYDWVCLRREDRYK